MDATRNGVLPQPLPLFPADNWWNLDISNWPVDQNSPSYINFINNGGTRKLHPDFGGNSGTGFGIYGMPYALLNNVTDADRKPVQFQYWDESDGVNLQTGASVPFYPIPDAAISQPYWVEGGDPGNVDKRSSQDRHLLLVDRERNHLYELYNVFYNATQGKWYAGSGAFFDMNTNNRRPDTWTSADAAGLAILPGLVRYDEVYDPNVTEINHALRVTVRATQRLRLPGLSSRRFDHRGVAHGRAPALEEHRQCRAANQRSQRAENLSRHAAIRLDRRGQRFGHVHHRHLRHPLEQWHIESCLCQSLGQ